MKIILLNISLVFILSCSVEKGISKKQDEKALDTENKEVTYQGYVKSIVIDETGLDGCEFLIHTENDSLVFQPINLLDEFKKDSLKIWLKYHQTRPVMTICMKGQPIDVLDVKLR